MDISGGQKRSFKVEVIDTRDLEPGVPVSEALLAVEKLILDKKADFIMGGPVRSEAALAAMPLLSKYKKVSILTTGVLTPKYHALVAEQYDKFKYCFRIHGEAKNLVGEMFANFTELKEKHGVSLTGEVYSHTCHSQPAFRKYPWAVANDPSDTFPQTEYVAKRHICLPLYSGLTKEEVDYTVDSLRKVL